MKNKINLIKIAAMPICLALLTSCGGGSGSSDKSVPDSVDNVVDACEAFDLTRTKIAHGEECSFTGKESSLVRLGIFSLEGEGSCTGTIISDSVVLTAAHCLQSSIIGIDIHTSNGLFVADDYLFPNEYFPGDFVTPAFTDIAVIRIKGKFGIKPMPLLLRTSAVRGENAFIGGFGEVNAGEGIDGVPRAGEAVVSEVSGNHIVLRDESNQAHPCFGDSGGPVAVARTKELILAGVVSQSDPSVNPDNFCEKGDVTLYTSVRDPASLAFINKFGGNFVSK
jgi:hypothetical protein